MASFDTTWDVDKYYSPHEPSHHWVLRKKFMEHNKDRFPEQRLVCLAQTFANIEFMGCRYPKATMDLVEDLAFGIVQEFREQQKGRLKRTFVSGSDAAEARVNRGSKRKSETPLAEETCAPKRTAFAGFVRASSDLITTPTSSAAPPQAKKPGSSRVPITFDTCDHLGSFIVVVLEWQPEEHPCNVLNRSAGFCRVPCSWEFEHCPTGQLCRVKVDGREVASAAAATKNEARDEAARNALEVLSQRCYTVRMKNKYLSDGTSVDLEGSGDKDSTVLGADNMGHKLLKLMGWSGGGLGKGGAGISEPITASAVRNREGFGNKSASRDFKQRVRKIVEEYAASSNPYDLVFTTGFDNDQRKEMHLVAKRLGLRSKSYGKEEERFITISRKTTGRQLLQELLARGGSNEKYTLVAPPAKK